MRGVYIAEMEKVCDEKQEAVLSSKSSSQLIARKETWISVLKSQRIEFIL